MNFKAKSLLGAMLLLTTFLVFSACENDMKEISAFSESLEPAVEKGKDIELYYSEQGNVAVRIRSPFFLRKKGREGYTEFPESWEATSYDDTGKPTSIITSKYAIRKDATDEILIKDSVVIRNLESKERLETEEITWSRTERKIKSDKFTTIYQERDTLYGKNGFESNEDFSKYNIKGLTGTKFVQESEAGQ